MGRRQAIPARGAVLVAACMLGAGCGVLPDVAPWRETERVIQPAEPSTGTFLSVDTEESGRPIDGVSVHRPFYIYSASGEWMDHHPNEFATDVTMAPGRYVIVSRIRGVDRRVQSVIRAGHLTRITRADLEAAPPAE